MSQKQDKEQVARTLANCLFLPTSDAQQDCVNAPVVILQNDAANPFQILERHFRPDALGQPDKFYRVVRDITGAATWRPRVNGIQLKMLQNMRLPETLNEWVAVQTAVTTILDCLRPESSLEAVIYDLQSFTESVQEWWANRKRGDGGGMKRVGSSLQPLAKRPSLLDLQAAGMYMMPDPTALQGMVAAMPVAITVPPPPIDATHVNGFVPDDNNNDTNSAPTNQEQEQQPVGPKDANKLCVVLNVGGRQFETTIGTLVAVEGSYLCKMGRSVATKSSAERQFFIDRSSRLFEYILDYLRSQRYKDSSFVMPTTAADLKRLLAEAQYYKLRELEEEVKAALLQTEQSSTVSEIVAVFVETGFNKGQIGDVELEELNKKLGRKVKAKQEQGYRVLKHESGTDFVDNKRNVYYNITMGR